MQPWLEEDGDPPVKEWRVQQQELDRIFKEALCIQCGCCVSECNSMEADPDFLGPAALAKAARFVGDVRDRGRDQRLRDLNGPHGVWDCTRCYFCNERCPKGVDPRDAIAKVGARSTRKASCPTRAPAMRRCSTSPPGQPATCWRRRLCLRRTR